MQPPQEILQLCAEQLGVLSRAQLVRRIGEYQADDLLRSGRFDRLHLGVYALRGGAVSPSRAGLAATLRGGADATLTGPTALSLHGVPATRPDQRFGLLLPAGRRLRSIDLPRLRDRDPTRPVSLRGEIRIAEPVDALLETGAFFPTPARELRSWHDRLRWLGLLRPGQLTERAGQLGLSRLLDGGELLDMDGTAATGEGERTLVGLMQRFEPPPEPQVWITPHRCVDLLFRDLLLALEYQGRTDHATQAGRQADRTRDEELDMAGVRVLYVTAEDLRTPRALLGRVAAALTARADELRLPAPRLCAA